MNNRYDEQVKQYQQQFITSIENDKELAKERAELLKLQENNPYGIKSSLLRDRLDTAPSIDISSTSPKKLKAVADIISTAKKVKSWNEERKLRKIERLQYSIANRIEAVLTRQRPDFSTLSAERALSYDMFLSSLRIDPALVAKQEFLKDFQHRARAVASQKGTQAILADLNELKANDDVINQHVTDIKQQQELFCRGQLVLHSQLSLLQTTQVLSHAAQQYHNAEQRESIEAVKSKLTRMGVAVDEDLKSLIDNNQEVRKQLTVMSDKFDLLVADLKERKEAQRIKDNFQGVMDTFGFVGSLGQVFGKPELCRVAKIGQAGVTIATAINALQGMTAAGPAALTPWMAIGSAALSIFSAFAKQGPDPHQITLDAINGLFDLIDQVRKELHIRFDQLEAMIGKTYATIIWNFAESRQQGYTLQQTLQKIQQELRSGFQVQQYSLQSIRDDLRGIASTQRVFGRYQSLEPIFPVIDEITTGQPLTEQRFAHLYHELNSKISDVHAVNVFLVGQDGEKLDVVKAFEQDANHTLCHDFNIASLQAHVTRAIDDVKNEGVVVNPTLWSWEMSAMMALVKKLYPTVENIEQALFRIHDGELQALEKHLNVAKRTQRFLVSLRDDKLINLLIANHQQSADKFKSELETYTLAEEAKVASELNSAWQNGVPGQPGIDAFQSAARELFHEEKIRINPTASSNWWKASGEWKTPKWDHRESNGCSPEGFSEIARLKNLYISNKEKEMRDFKIEYVAAKLRPATLAGQNNQLVATNEFKFFADLQVRPHFHYAFTYPENNDLPVLPMPAHYEPPIPNELQAAEWLGLGKVAFRYAIADNKFIFKTLFKMNGVEHLVSKLEVNYDPMVFSGGEGVWAFWVGGNVATSAVAKQQVKHTNNSGTEYWSFSDVPVTKHVKGRRDTIKREPNGRMIDRTENGKVSVPVEVVEIKADSPFITNIKQSIKAKQQELTRHFAKGLVEKLKGESVSPLANALVDYAHSYYMLQAAIVKGFGHHADFCANELGYFSTIQALPLSMPTLIRDRIDFMRYLSSYQDEEMSFAQVFERSQLFFSDNVVSAMEILFHSAQFNRSLFDETVQKLSELIDWYHQPGHHVADEMQQSAPALQQEQNRLLSASYQQSKAELEVLKAALLGIQDYLPPEVVRTFGVLIHREATNRGLNSLPHLQGLLPGSSSPTADEEKRPASVTLFARSNRQLENKIENECVDLTSRGQTFSRSQ